MSKKTRSTSTRTAKQRRQKQALATRRALREQADLARTHEALDEAAKGGPSGSLRVVCPDGATRDLTFDRMWAHMEADIAADGEPPFGDYETFLRHAHIDLDWGALWLRPDGLWESGEDYFTDREPKR